ncbi:MAG TPA: hypothetical protein VKS78_09115 [Roseiarcus sp.]|nr:hypothetical protein [Roseiarcus sp.]
MSRIGVPIANAAGFRGAHERKNKPLSEQKHLVLTYQAITKN